MTLSISTPSAKNGDARFEWLWWITLLSLVTLLWCAAYNRWTLEAWKTPVVYDGDALAVMASAKAFASGEIYPIAPKYPGSLGAPFTANWNDYPSPAEGLFAWAGLLSRIFGIFAGTNVTVLCAHLLAASSFYLVSRILGYRRILALSGAIVFSLSRYAFARNLSHLGPLYYWHIPLALLVIWWAVAKDSLFKNPKKVWFCIIVAVLHGIQDPYFSGMFLHFLVLASVVCLIRGETWRRILFPLGIAAVVLATSVLMNLDTFQNRLVAGPNTDALVRDYAALETYALKPVELFLPVVHRISALQNWAHHAYLQQARVLGEVGSAYLGIIGIAGLAFVIWATARAAVLGAGRSVPSHFWLVLWVLIYSIIGGVNGFLGLFGVILFRSSNRYSIVILAIVLLFLIRQLTLITQTWHRFSVAALAAFITVVGLFDQTPRRPDRGYMARVRAQVLSDGKVVSTLEGKLPPHSMVFELPVCVYPEAGPVREMQDYEHFRPYLQSRSLRFSYGNIKGRTRERWQTEVVRFGTAYLVDTLERYGFSVILINKKAYEMNAAGLLADLAAAGHSEILGESNDLVCVRLRPDSNPILPPEFDRNWSDLEGTAVDNWRWSGGNARIILYNHGPQTKKLRISFSLSTLRPRTIQISAAGQELFTGSLPEGTSSDPIRLVVNVPPGRCELLFHTNIPGERPGNGDERKLAFNVRNFTIEQ